MTHFEALNDVFRILAEWKNRYGNSENKFAKDGAFTSMDEEKKSG